MSKETHKSKLSTQGSFLPQAVPCLQQKAALRLPGGIPVYLVTPTWYSSHRSIQFPLEHTETSNIHILRMKFQNILTPFPKDHLPVFVLHLPSRRFKWHPLILVLEVPANSHSAVTLSLAYNLIDIYCIPLCHLFFSLEESYSILSFLTGKRLNNSRSSPSLFPEPRHAVPFVPHIP